MLVFKFGGASVKDAKAIRNVSNILNNYKEEKIIVVFSAMGKTTNLLEKINLTISNKNKVEFKQLTKELSDFHFLILNDLFPHSSHPVHEAINFKIKELEGLFDQLSSSNLSLNYSKIVSYGEMISTIIICSHLQEQNISAEWLDARSVILTQDKHEDTKVLWKETIDNYFKNIPAMFSTKNIIVTQGFIGENKKNETTTLGREGSDFSAAILAYCGDAKQVIIWKDVPGMLNADPKYFENTVKLDSISYREALELSYYGASVIHPKTIKPLHNKQIPLYIKSFVKPKEEGTTIQGSKEKDALVPSFIFKHNQILFSIKPKDFSFLVEENLSDIFDRLARVNAKINVMQNSALSFSILLDRKKIDLEKILNLFKEDYTIRYNEGLELVTIRHYDQETVDFVTKGKRNILEQKTRQTIRIVLKSNH